MTMEQYISKDKLVAEIKDLYEDINKCIGDLVLARSKHDQRGISDAHWKMETLMVNTQQVLSYILPHLEVKEVELTWEDMRELYIIFAEIDAEIESCKIDIQGETIGYYQEALKRFKNIKRK